MNNVDKDKLKQAIFHHQTTNSHHPEYWGKISEMPLIHLAEFVCDAHARSVEFGTDLREWIMTKAYVRHEISPKGKVAKSIKYFLDHLLDRPFKS